MWNLGVLSRRLDPRREDGIALIVALGVLIVFSVTTVTAITMIESTQTTSNVSSAQQNAYELAEAGLNNAESVLYYQLANNGDPSAANLIGCNGAGGVADPTAPSNCTTPSPKVFCVTASSPCSSSAAGTASVFGYYSGTNVGSYNGTTVAASTWLLTSTGFAASTQGGLGTVTRTLTATVKVSPLNGGGVASVWNHLFLTAPLVANVCQTNFAGNGLIIDVPLYVIGNLCVSGNNDAIEENGAAVDLQVGGKLSLSANGTSVGADSSHPITSGVVVGGCTTGLVTSATTTCNAATHYYATTTDTFTSQAAPAESATDLQNDYNTFDPGPKHSCQTGTNPAPPAASSFDGDSTYNNSAGTFNLTPNASYTCNSQSGSSIGQLSWNNTTKTLTIAGSIFIDGSLSISQSVYYVGTAVIEVAGTVSMSGNGTTVCATSPCNYALSKWQGTSGNNSMLTLVPLLKSTNTAFALIGNTQAFQGSIWTDPSSGVTLSGNNVVLEGPISVGTLVVSVNNATIEPLPVIKNMPVGAPVPPNTNASVSAPVITN
jgi:Tfp pilus assembly protein PilX